MVLSLHFCSTEQRLALAHVEIHAHAVPIELERLQEKHARRLADSGPALSAFRLPSRERLERACPIRSGYFDLCGTPLDVSGELTLIRHVEQLRRGTHPVAKKPRKRMSWDHERECHCHLHRSAFGYLVGWLLTSVHRKG